MIDEKRNSIQMYSFCSRCAQKQLFFLNLLGSRKISWSMSVGNVFVVIAIPWTLLPIEEKKQIAWKCSMIQSSAIEGGQEIYTFILKFPLMNLWDNLPFLVNSEQVLGKMALVEVSLKPFCRMKDVFCGMNQSFN